MKVLFVCSVNRLRSLTAHHVFRMTHPQHEYKSAGTDVTNDLPYNSELGSNILKQEFVEWADRIICMEKYHVDKIMKRFERFVPDLRKKIWTANIKDNYDYMSPVLIQLLEDKILLGGRVGTKEIDINLVEGLNEK